MFDESLLKDPGYFRENRVDAHSDHAYFLSEAELDSGKMSMRESLNGLWKFFYAQNPGQVIPGFESAIFQRAVPLGRAGEHGSAAGRDSGAI